MKICDYVVMTSLKLGIIERLQARTPSRFFGHFWKCSKIHVAIFWHVGFILPEKHCSEVFFTGLLFIFEKKKRHSTGKKRMFFGIKLCNISKTKQTFEEEIWDNIPKQNCMWNLERFCWPKFTFSTKPFGKRGSLLWWTELILCYNKLKWAFVITLLCNVEVSIYLHFCWSQKFKTLQIM